MSDTQPLVRKDIVPLIHSIREQCDPLGLRDVAVTTNALVLQRRLASLVQAGLTAVNVSLDTLCAEKFERMTRRKGLQRVVDAIKASALAGLPQNSLSGTN